MYNFDPYNVLLAIANIPATEDCVCAPGTHIAHCLHVILDCLDAVLLCSITQRYICQHSMINSHILVWSAKGPIKSKTVGLLWTDTEYDSFMSFITECDTKKH